MGKAHPDYTDIMISSLTLNPIPIVLSGFLFANSLSAGENGQRSWPGFRGSGLSLSSARDLPIEWSDKKNIAWKIDLDGYGQSSPVVWEDRVFVTSAQGEEKETLRIDCFDLETGNSLWEKSFPASQKVKKSRYVSYAAPTPVADENFLYAFFESGDVIALDHDGELRWTRSLTKDYGAFAGNHGLGSSPALSSTGLVVLVDHSGPSYLICLDKETGKNLWKSDREERVSWSSPIVVQAEEGEEILISSNGIAESYDAAAGERKWFFDGIEGNTVASPTSSGDLVIIGSSGKDQSRAIRRDGSGDDTGSHQAWQAEEAASSFGSPLVYDENVYFVNRAGVAFCNDLATGKLNWTHRLPASTWASPVGAGDRIYFFSTNGATTILRTGAKEPVSLGVSTLSTDDRVYGVAVVDGHLVFRMETRLVCVRSSPPDTTATNR